MHTRRSLLKKTAHLAGSTFISRILGLVREILQIRYLGVGGISDAFVTAFNIPNSLRKIFAEGAVSAAFVPTIVKVTHQEGKKQASKVITLIFLGVQNILLLVCLLMFIGTPHIIHFASPGWFDSACNTAQAQTITTAQNLFRILIFFIICISSTSLFAGALQSVSHFTIPAIGQIFLNIGIIFTLVMCSWYQLPVQYYAFGILISAIFLVMIHWWAYKKEGFTFEMPNQQAWKEFKQGLKKFLPCLLSVGALEINLFIDRQLASYLPAGSTTLLYYTYSFMRFPLGMLIAAFSTIMLPHITRVSTHTPNRLSFYAHETIKLIFWIMIPLSFLMIFFADKIFSTVMLSHSFSLANAQQAGLLLSIFAVGLVFFSLNRVLLNFYYALHVTLLPTCVTLVGTVLNTFLNMLLMRCYGVFGIAAATVIAGMFQTVILLILLYQKFNFIFYGKRLMHFIISCCVQFLSVGLLFYATYCFGLYCISFFSAPLQHIVLNTLGFWFWVAPLCGIVILILYLTRKIYRIHLYFLE
ncbi:MAG: murein biosynthesis integral membrane protein MurJ [Candidatus Babeliaceae bacterium]